MFLTALLCIIGAIIPSILAQCKPNHDIYCYTDPECGPESNFWGGMCKTGTSQTPIQLPENGDNQLVGNVMLRLSNYRGSFFQLTNNGHTVALNFTGTSGSNEGPSSNLFPFPDPLLVTPMTEQRVKYYRFDSLYAHWGSLDSNGSEHCILGGRCSSMELHFVHYLPEFKDLSDAVTHMADEKPLAVLGVFVNVGTPGPGTSSPLSQIAKQLKDIKDTNATKRIDESIDLSPLFRTGQDSRVYSYKGSLTTPKCAEPVHWFVVKQPYTISKEDMESFRSQLIDSHCHKMVNNYRPIQPKHQRQVYLSMLAESVN